MRKLAILIITLIVIGAAGLVMAEGRVEERRSLSPRGLVEIENIAGTVEVVGWDRDEVEVTARLGRGTERLEVSGDEDHISIEVLLLEDHHNVEGSDLQIRVPRGCRLEVETIAATIDVSGVTGHLELESVSGNITVRGEPETVELQNISGHVEFISEGTLEEGEFQSVVGDIRVAVDFARGGRFEFESVSGDIEIRVPRRVSADFEISSFSGGIDNDFGVSPRSTSNTLLTKELRFSLGRGEARVSAQTLSGSIRLRER